MKKRKLRIKLFITTGVFLVLLPIVFFSIFKPNSTEAVWYDDTFAYRKKITFTHNADITSDRRVSITIDTATLTTDKMQADCDDTRFTDINGRLLNFQEVSGCDSASTVYDVVINPTINGQNVLYFYYGNPSAVNASNDVSGVTSLSPSGADITQASEESGTTPVAAWTFDDSQGQTTEDNSSNSNDGILGASASSGSDDPTWTTEDQCISGKCLKFDGSNDFVQVANNTSLQLTRFSISFWMKPIDAQSGATQAVLVRAATSGQVNYGFYWDHSNSTFRQAVTFYNGSAYITAKINQTMSTNKWYFVTGTFDGSNLKVYLDGNLDTTTSSSTTPLTTGGYKVAIGANNSNDNMSGYFKGFIDEPKIYNYARTAAQVKADFLRGGAEGSSASFGSFNQKSLSDGLIGYWKMDETSWTNNCSTDTVLDSSGNGNNGDSCPNTTGPTGGVAGKFGNGGNFDGTDEYIDIANWNPGTSSFTLSAWFNLDSSVSATDDPFPIFGNVQNTPLLGYNPSTKQFFHLRQNATTGNESETWTTTPNLADDTWHHVSLSIDQGKDTATVYLDGVNLGTNATADGGWDSNSNGHLNYLGRDFASYWKGELDDLRHYSRALSAQEARYLYNFGPGPVGYWKFDDGSGTSATDNSGNAFSGTLTDASTGNTDLNTPPLWKEGKFGNALLFDGIDDFVSLSGNTTLNFGTKDFSVELWFKGTSFHATNAALIEMTEAQNDFNPLVTIRGNSNGTLNFLVRDTTTNVSSTTTNVYNNNAWHYASLVKSGSSYFLYVDGIIAASVTGTALGDINVSGYVNIGRTNDTTNRYLNGAIDDVKVYNYARTAGQVVEDMNGGHPLAGSPVGSQTAHWRLDEQQGTTINNSSTESFTTSISGATWKTKENCKINGCLDFDGTDDVLTITNEAAIDFDTNLVSGVTFSAWIYADSDGENDTGQFFQKGTNTYCRTDTQSGSNLDIECSLDLTTSDATLNISSGITTGAWNHIAVSYSDDSDDEITIWINGKKRGTSTNGSGTPAITDTANLLIGGTTTANFDGRVDDFKVYSTELGTDAIAVDANANSAINFGVGTDQAAMLSDGAGNPPVLYWEMNEKTGTSTFDKGTTKLTGTLSGSTLPQWTRGKAGAALEFDGANSYVSASGTTFAGAITFNAWFYKRNTSYELLAGGGSANEQIGVTPSTPSVTFRNTTGGITNVTLTGTLAINTWHYLTVTRDGSGNVKVYINGVDRTSGSYTNSGTHTVNNIGIRSDLLTTQAWDGYIDDVKVYDYVRTQAQIAYDYNRGGPVGHWRFDECQNTTAYDSSGNGNNGTITIGATGTYTAAGNCLSGTSTHAWYGGVTGKYNSSLAFDGTNDYVPLSSTTGLLQGNNNTYSISAWFKTTSSSSTRIYTESSSSTTTPQVHLGVNRFATGDVALEHRDDTSTLATVQSPVGTRTANNGNWHHVAAVRESGSTFKLYYDGNLISTSSSQTPTTTTTNSVCIGARCTTVTDSYFNGQIDDVRVYNYALSASQVKQVMNDASNVRFGPNSGQP